MISHKVHAIVEYIKGLDFDLDMTDVTEMSPYQIMAHFGIGELLTEWEEAEFLSQMELLADRYQTSQIVSSVFEA